MLAECLAVVLGDAAIELRKGTSCIAFRQAQQERFGSLSARIAEPTERKS